MMDFDAWRSWAMTAPAPDFWLWTLGALGLAGLAGVLMFRFVRRARLIEDTPTSKIRSAHQGYVELIGTGNNLAGQSLAAPLTLTPCIWYDYRIERRVQGGKSRRWQTVKSETSSQPLLLEDGTGQCVINPAGAEVIPSVSRTWHGNAAWPAGKAAPGDGGLLRMLTGQGRYRYTERRIHPGEPLYALGDFVTLGAEPGSGDVHRQVSATLRNWKQKPEVLLRNFDSDGDGRLGLDEWERVREAARQKVLRDTLAHAGREPVHTLARSRNGQPFLLSVQSPRRMSRHYRLRAVACLAGFVLAGPAGIWMLLIRLAG